MITRPEIVKRRWRTLRAGVLIPAVGILVGATAVGTLILVNRDDTPTPDRNPVTAPVVAPSRPAAPLPGATISATDPQVGLAPAATLDRGAAGGSDTGLIDPLVIEAPGP